MKFLAKTLTGFLWLVASLVILAAISLNVLRFSLPHLHATRARLERWVSSTLHANVKIGKVNAYWSGVNPVFEFSHARLLGRHHHTLAYVRYLQIKVDVIQSLLHMQLLPQQVVLNGSQLTFVQQASGALQLQGEQATAIKHAAAQGLLMHDALSWLLQQGDLVVRDVQLKVVMHDKHILQLKNLALDANRSGSNTIEGDIVLSQPQVGRLKFVLTVGQGGGLPSIKIYTYAQQLKLGLLSRLLPKTILAPRIRALVQHAWWDGDSWVAIKNGSVVSIQTQGSVRHLEAQAVAALMQHTTRTTHLHVSRVQQPKQTTSSVALPPIDSVACNLDWQQQALGWQLSVDKLQLRQGTTVLGPIVFKIQKKRSPRLTYLFATEHFDLAQLRTWHKAALHTLLPDNLWKWQQTLQLQGMLKYGSLAWLVSEPVDRMLRHASVLPAWTRHVRSLVFDLDDAHWRATGHIPGISHMDGKLNYRPGKVQLLIHAAPHAELNMPQLFAAKLPIDALKVEFNGRMGTKDAQLWQLHYNNLTLQSQSLHLEASGTLQKLGAAKPVTIDTTAQFSLADAAQVKYFLPQQHMSKHLHQWLAQAFKSGAIQDGTLDWRADLHHFPTASDREKYFKVGFDWQHGDFHYADHWPDILNFSSHVLFKGVHMQVQSTAGTLSQANIKSISAHIHDLRHASLKLQGHVVGALQQARQFIINSPLSFRHGLAMMQMQGPLDLWLHLHIPLADKKKLARTDAKFSTSQADITFPEWKLKAHLLDAHFKIINNHLFAPDLTADFLGHPAAVSISTHVLKNTKGKAGINTAVSNPSPSQRLQITVKGQADAQQLMQGRKLFFTPFVQGSFPFQAQINIYSGPIVTPNTVKIESNGLGLSVAMPKPFFKQADDSLAITTNILFPLDDHSPAIWHVSAGSRWSMALALLDSHHGAVLDRGEIRLNAPHAKLPQQAGLTVMGSVYRFNWAEWKPYLLRAATSEASASDTAVSSRHTASSSRGDDSSMSDDSTLLHRVNLQLGRLQYQDFLFNNVALNILFQPKFYQAQIDNKLIKGAVTIPRNLSQGKLVLRLQKLQLPFPVTPQAKTSSNTQSTAPGMSLAQLDPRSLPSIDAAIDVFKYNTFQMHKLAFVTSKVKEGVKLNQLVVQSQDVTAKASGSWLLKNKQSFSSLKGNLTSSDVGSMVKRWGLTDMLVGGEGDLQFNLSWPGSIFPLQIAATTGQLVTNIKKGRIVGLDSDSQGKVGLGKMLNLLSIQTLPRRLALDFSDLTKKGYSFDVMRAALQLKKGHATLKDGYLDGPIARVILNGKLNFITSYYNMLMDVRPHLTSTLPIIAALAATPIAGIVTWMINKAVVGPVVGRVARKLIRADGYWNRKDKSSVNIHKQALPK